MRRLNIQYNQSRAAAVNQACRWRGSAQVTALSGDPVRPADESPTSDTKCSQRNGTDGHTLFWSVNKRQTTHVKILAPLATLLMVLLWTQASDAATDTPNSPANLTTTRFESPVRSTPVEEPFLISVVTAKTNNNDRLSETLQNLSPGPFLVLGIVGLFWIRSHMVDL
jgi:hypothetical protein